MGSYFSYLLHHAVVFLSCVDPIALRNVVVHNRIGQEEVQLSRMLHLILLARRLSREKL